MAKKKSAPMASQPPKAPTPARAPAEPTPAKTGRGKRGGSTKPPGKV